VRVLDTIVLFGAPKVWRAHVRAGWLGFTRSPHLIDEFGRVEAARRAKQSLVELTYGETPVVEAWRILRRAGVNKKSVFIDLGCGRGRVLLAARALGARVRGIDLMRAHVDVIERAYADAGISVVEGDATSVPVDDATHVYVTWTCMSAATRERVQENLRTLLPGARVITVTHEMDDDEAFLTLGSMRAFFTWGFATVYLHERR
jgi:SAM-dependent methyltransferase